MNAKWIIVGVLVVLAVAIVVILTLALTPQETPAFETAVDFAVAAGRGDDQAAFALLSADMQHYVIENCPGGSAVACIESYTPVEWGRFQNAVFRRSRPDGAAWDVLLIATYEKAQGFSGVCIYQRMAQDVGGAWRVYGWSGFVSCDEPAAGLQELADSLDAPNRAP